MFNFFKRIFESDQPPANNLESLKIIYTEVTNVIHIYYEWRHKVITWYITAGSAVGAATAWLHEHHEYQDRLWVIFLFFAIVSLVLLLMDRVNTDALMENYKLAKCLEKEMSKSQDFSVYESAHTRYIKFENSKFCIFPNPIKLNSYAAILFWAYLLSAIGSFYLAYYFYPTDSKSHASTDNKCTCCIEISEKKCVINKTH